MPQAWEFAHFIILEVPLLHFCLLQCPLSLKAKDYLKTLPPTGKGAHEASPEATLDDALCISIL